MNRHLAKLLCAAALVGWAAACATTVDIRKDDGATSTSSSSSSSGTTMTTTQQGSGGSTTSSSTSSSSSSSGTMAGPGKVITAETDIGQYISVTVPQANKDGTQKKVLDGPLFLSDVTGSGQLFTVTDGNCSVATPTTVVFAAGEAHGMHLPILPGQTLCCWSGPSFTILGFKPY